MEQNDLISVQTATLSRYLSQTVNENDAFIEDYESDNKVYDFEEYSESDDCFDHPNSIRMSKFS
jgi:hypothetical protein